MNKELISKVISYNYNEFGEEFGDCIVDMKNEIERLNNIINRAINFINYCETDVNFGIEISESTKCDLLDILKGEDEE